MEVRLVAGIIRVALVWYQITVNVLQQFLGAAHDFVYEMLRLCEAGVDLVDHKVRHVAIVIVDMWVSFVRKFGENTG